MLQLGFACDWSVPRQTTWSGTPLALFQALERAVGEQLVDLIDLDAHLPRTQQILHKVWNLSRHPHSGSLQTEAAQSPARLRTVEKRLMQLIQQSAPLDAVLSISDLAKLTSPPQFIYFDLCIAAFRSLQRDKNLALVERVHYRDAFLAQREKHQRAVYRDCAGLFAMSSYAARGACEAYSLDPSLIHVVGAGATVVPCDDAPRLHERDYLLFVGRDFERKAGPLVLQAYAKISQELNIDLLVAGPDASVVDALSIAGVRALGPLPATALQSYFAHAKAFVMPSYFEAYGIVFAEALAQGVPVIGRNSCAMPEIIRDADNGYLLPAECRDPQVLANTMQKIVHNTDMRQRVQSQKDEVRRHYSWDRVAREMIEYINAKVVGGSNAQSKPRSS